MIAKMQVAAHALAYSGLGAVIRRVSEAAGVLALAYHRIGDEPDSPYDRALWSATPEAFDEQVRWLKRNFDIVSPADVEDLRRRHQHQQRNGSRNGRRGGRRVLITFDDGYRDNYEVALPILRSHGAVATFFVSTGFIDRPRVPWWDEIAWMVRSSRRRELGRSPWLTQLLRFDSDGDRQRAIDALLAVYKALPGEQTTGFLGYLADATGSGRCSAEQARDLWMSWDMIRQMRAAGMTIGGHTVDHPILSRLPAEEQWRQIGGCRQRIEQELNEPMRYFSYPRGKLDSFNQDTRRCLREAGVELAFSYYGGLRRFDEWDPYDVCRSSVELDVDRSRFQAVLTLPQMFGGR